MFLKQLKVQGYKNFNNEFTTNLSNGLNVIVGENGIGKTSIINSIRMLLFEDEFGRSYVDDTDFYRSLDNAIISEKIKISGIFEHTDENEKIVFLPWENVDEYTQLNIQIDNKANNRGKYKKTVWAGESRSSAFEWDLFNLINCIYLPPLRDAESKLKESKSSRLARLLKNLCKKELIEHRNNSTLHPLEQKVKTFNDDLSQNDESIRKANSLIKDQLEKSLGPVFGQDTNIQYTELNFNRIVESLRLVFFPEIGLKPTSDLYRSLEENSLGYNNILYLATVLAELTNLYDEPDYVKILLIEEPEAHLHPQLQIRLLKYLEKMKDVQIVVTTHSPVIAPAVNLNSLIHLSSFNNKITSVQVKNCGLEERKSLQFISRWLDITKSTLLFSKGIILVEGIAEAMLLPELAKIVLKEYNNKNSKQVPSNLEDAGVSVINQNGIYFKHFMQLFCNLGSEYDNIPILCAGITDQDPPKKIITNIDGKTKEYKFYPIQDDIIDNSSNKSTFKFPPTVIDEKFSDGEDLENTLEGLNKAIDLIDIINKSEYARLFINPLKTLEYDLAMEGNNLDILIPIAIEILDTNPIKLDKYNKIKWDKEVDISQKAKVAYELLLRIENQKGEFSQRLADKLSNDDSINFSVPKYIEDAVFWVMGIKDDKE